MVTSVLALWGSQLKFRGPKIYRHYGGTQWVLFCVLSTRHKTKNTKNTLQHIKQNQDGRGHTSALQLQWQGSSICSKDNPLPCWRVLTYDVVQLLRTNCLAVGWGFATMTLWQRNPYWSWPLVLVPMPNASLTQTCTVSIPCHVRHLSTIQS